MKTIAELNTKAWYRLLKVTFGLSFIILLITLNTIIFSDGIRKINREKTLIKCNSKNKAEFSPASINLNLSSKYFQEQFNYKKFFEDNNEFSIKSIAEVCSPKTINNLGTNDTGLKDIYDVQKVQEIKNAQGLSGVENLNKEQIDKLEVEYYKYEEVTKNIRFSNEKTRYLDFSFKLFDITPVFNYNSFLKFFLLGNFVIFILFEVIRRMFYYIVLGNVKPNKIN